MLHPHDSSTEDKDAPQFLQLLPEESIVMENHPHEFQAGIAGGNLLSHLPPFYIYLIRPVNLDLVSGL